MNTPKQSSIFMLLWLWGQILMSFAISVLNSFTGQGFSTTEMLLITQFAGNLLPVAVALIYCKRKNVSIFPIRNPGLKNTVLMFFIALTVQPIATALSALSSIFFQSDTLDSVSQIGFDNPIMISLILLALIPAVTEELVCRGVILNGYRNVKPYKAVLINGLLFGIMHMNFRQFFYAFLLGAILAYVVIYTKSVISGIIMHFTINGSQVLLANFAMGEASATAEFEGSIPVEFVVIYAIIVLISTIICAVLLILLKKHNGALPESGEIQHKTLNLAFIIVVVIGILLMCFIG